MSDDGYYEYDPEYEEFTDMLYEADANPDLADDLAGRATYSPTWQDDATEELRDYFSDWEYYSDDYFDDDPTLMREKGEIRGKKRKATEAGDGFPSKRHNALTACLRGTVWKKSSPEPPIRYRKGMVKPVALKLDDKIMKAAYSRGAGFGRSDLRRDESWANDLSLADMGLKTETSTGIHDASNTAAVDEEEDEDEDLVSQAVDDDEEDDAEIQETADNEQHEDIHLSNKHDLQEDIDDRPRKRKKELVNDSDNNGLQPVQQVDPDSESTIKSTQRSTTKEIRATNSTKKPSITSEPVINGVTKANGTTRKRKLSNSETSAMTSTASNRAKRLDNKKTTTTSKSIPVTAASSRPARKAKS